MKPSPERATMERQGKRKAEADGKRKKTSGGGGGQKRLNQPDTAKTYNNLSTQRAKPTWREENARTHEIGTHGEQVNDIIHPHCMQNFVIRLKGPRLSFQPHRRLSVVKWITCTIQPHQTTKKEVTTPVKHVLLPGVSCEKGCGQPLEITERVLTRLQSTIPWSSSKRWFPGTAGIVSTQRLRQGENRKKASSSLYLDELLIQKCKFRHRFTVNF